MGILKKIYMLFFLLAILFEPIICIKYSITNYIYIIGAVCAFAYIIYKYYISNIKISKTLWLIIIYRVCLLIPTILYESGDLLKWGYFSIVCIALYMILSISMKDDYKKTISILSNIFSTLLILNLISYIAFPDGLYMDTDRYSKLYFLGIRTRFTDYAYAEFVLLTMEWKFATKNKIKLIILGLICLLNIVLPSVTTGIIAIAIFVLLMLLLKVQNMHNILTYNRLIIIFLILNVLVVNVKIQNNFSDSIEKYFNKDATLTGRTAIWDLSWEYFYQKPILGYGIRNDGSFVKINGVSWQGHNQLIQCLHDGGIVSLILFILILYNCGKNLKGNNNKNIKIILTSALFGYFIIMISEVSAYYLPFFALLFISENVKYIEGSENKE